MRWRGGEAGPRRVTALTREEDEESSAAQEAVRPRLPAAAGHIVQQHPPGRLCSVWLAQPRWRVSTTDMEPLSGTRMDAERAHALGLPSLSLSCCKPPGYWGLRSACSRGYEQIARRTHQISRTPEGPTRLPISPLPC